MKKFIYRFARRVVPQEARNRIRSASELLHRDHRYHEKAHRQELMRRVFAALSFNRIEGAYVEFGCNGALTFSLAYHASRERGYECPMWAFDSFEGLPEPACPEDHHPAWVAGTMSSSLEAFHSACRKLGVRRDAYRTVEGFYDETLTGDVGDLPSKIAFAYIDCDLYSSTRTVLDFLADRMQHGMIVACDDYFCFSQDNLSGERRAVLEFLRDSPYHFAPFCQYGWHGMSFIVEDKAPPPGLDDSARLLRRSVRRARRPFRVAAP